MAPMTERGLVERVAATIARHRLWDPGQRVAVAGSGGLDSVVLADVLHRSVGLHGGELIVATVDHGTRSGSAADAASVVALAGRLGLPVVVRELALGSGASEATCREARHAALRSVGADVVALAHHRRDQAETLLIRLLRGTGPGGLCGMPFRAGDRVRPLLDVDPADLLAWARARDLAFVDDPSKKDPRFLRNRVRHEVLPLLESLRPGVEAALARTASAARDEAEWVDDVVAGLVQIAEDGSFDAAALASLPPPPARRALLVAWPMLQVRHLDPILRACDVGAGAVDVGAGVRVVVNRGRVRISPPLAVASASASSDVMTDLPSGGACET